MATHAIEQSVQSGDVEAGWRDIASYLDRIMSEPAQGIDISSLMRLYTIVHNYCTAQETAPAADGDNATSSVESRRGAHLLGGDLYGHLTVYLQAHLVKLRQRLNSDSGQILLTEYLEESARYINAAQITSYIFRYLNRHWVERELDEGKKSIYDIFTLHFVLWHSELFGHLREELIDAISEVVDKRRLDDNAGQLHLLLDFIISLPPDSIESSDSTRDFYGNLLETPWRLAIQKGNSNDSPNFFYSKPVTSILNIEDQSRSQLEERLISLMLRFGFSQQPKTGGNDGETVRLVAADETIVVAQQTAGCSYLIKSLYTFFSPETVAREPIPISVVTGEVLRKVLAWCEHHKNDEGMNVPDTSTTSRQVHRKRPVQQNEWDKKYFNIERKMLFNIITAANYLEIKPLLDAACREVANQIIGKSPEEIRSTFKCTNDYTP